MDSIERFDSAALFSIFRNEDGENLLPFEDMAEMLDLGEMLTVPDVVGGMATGGIPLIPNYAPGAVMAPMVTPPMVVTTAPPAGLPLTDNAGGVQSINPSTSGVDSEHTRAQGWGSNPSTDGDSGDSDMEGGPQQGEGGTRRESGKSVGRSGGGGKSSSGVRKGQGQGRRQRNPDQMENNRVAQQKYRQRKKTEQNALQQAVDMLTAQLAALKAVEVRNVELEATNAALHTTMSQQGNNIVALQQHSAAQAAELEATRHALGHSQAAAAAAHKVIMDQGAKLRLQEQIIASLKDRLKERIDEAMMHVVPGTVCEKMVAAVKATLYGAKDVSGLQDVLSQLPEHLVHEICKSIWAVCKETFPDLRRSCGALASSCTAGTV